MRKRIFAMLVALIMAISLLPVSALANNTDTISVTIYTTLTGDMGGKTHDLKVGQVYKTSKNLLFELDKEDGRWEKDSEGINYLVVFPAETTQETVSSNLEDFAGTAEIKNGSGAFKGGGLTQDTIFYMEDTNGKWEYIRSNNGAWKDKKEDKEQALFGDVTFIIDTTGGHITPATYTVTWINEGATYDTDTNVAYGTSVNELKPANPSKASTAQYNYTFRGWATSENGTVVDLSGATVTGNVTYYAVYEATTQTYTVTWINGGTTYDTDTNVAYGTSVNELKPANPSKASTAQYNYTFRGWATSENGTVVDLSGATVTGNVTYYAVYEDVEYNPDAGKQINEFTKALITDANKDAVPEGVITNAITIPANTTDVVEIPASGSVTLLYKLTVTGEDGAAYTITDTGATVVSGSLSGTLDSTGTAVIYVTRTFTAPDANGTLTNSATIAAGDNTTAPSNPNASATVPAVVKPNAPNEDTVKRLLGDKVVTVDCVNTEINPLHTDITYGLLPDGYTIGDVEGNAEKGYTCKVTFYADVYQAAYNTSTDSKHELDPQEQREQPVSIVLTWNGEKWTAPNEYAVRFTVTCDGDSSYYTVTYNDGVENKEVFEDQVYNDLLVGDDTPAFDGTPTRPGYRFVGWTPKWSETVTGDVTYTAQWRRSYHPTTPAETKPKLNKADHYAYVVGYPDGTVQPQGAITRAEVATIFFRLLSDETRDLYWTKDNAYTDIKAGDWFNNAVSTLSNAGIINGYPDGTFRPNAPITRAEMAKVIAMFAELDKDSEGFKDIAGHWAEAYIKLAAGNGWIAGYPDGTFRPNQDITRAETMTMINRVLERVPSEEEHLLSRRVMLTFPDNQPGDWYYIAVQEATNSHTYERYATEKNGDEQWIKLIDNYDWTKLEF